jgi:hypothetical protein
MTKSATAFDVYRSYDPDLWECNEPAVMGTYAVNRDESVLTLPEHVKPTKFRCRVLTRDQRRIVDEAGTPNGKRMQAFRFGLVEILDVQVDAGTYKTFTPSRAAAKDALAPTVLDAIEELGFGDRDMWDIGAAIVARSFLARGVQPCCELPASSQLACAQMLSRIAERQQGSLTQTDDSSAKSTLDETSAEVVGQPTQTP